MILNIRWKDNWNNSINIIGGLQIEAKKMMDGFLIREESITPSITAKIKKDAQHKNPFVQMAQAIIIELLRRLDNGESDLAKKVTRTHHNAGVTQLIYSTSFSIILKFNDSKSAEAADRTCNFVAEGLVKKHEKGLVESLITSINVMKDVRNHFKEVLDPLLLRPMILRTTCDLCPA